MAKTVVYGVHSVRAVIANGAGRIEGAWATGNCDASILDALRQIGVEARRVSGRDLDQRTGGGRHQGIAVDVVVPEPLNEAQLKDLVRRQGSRLIAVVLDGVQDPRNLGAALRTAAAAGADVVIIPKDRAARLTPAAIKVASGAAMAVPLARVSNLARVLRFLAEESVTVVGASEDAAETLYEGLPRPPLALVMGAEGRGLRRLTREHCAQTLRIPMAEGADSLNVAAALAVFLFEIRRRNL